MCWQTNPPEGAKQPKAAAGAFGGFGPAPGSGAPNEMLPAKKLLFWCSRAIPGLSGQGQNGRAFLLSPHLSVRSWWVETVRPRYNFNFKPLSHPHLHPCGCNCHGVIGAGAGGFGPPPQAPDIFSWLGLEGIGRDVLMLPVHSLRACCKGPCSLPTGCRRKPLRRAPKNSEECVVVLCSRALSPRLRSCAFEAQPNPSGPPPGRRRFSMLLGLGVSFEVIPIAGCTPACREPSRRRRVKAKQSRPIS